MRALITGASSGIGRELAKLHAAAGDDLVLVARREERLLELKSQLQSQHKVRVEVLASDLSAEGAVEDLAKEIEQRGLQVDYLINNAGFGGRGYFHERDWQQDEAMIRLNVIALTALCRRFLPGMVERDQGRILNVASTAGMAPAGPLQAVYFATKAYVLSLSQGIAGELLDTNVTVTALCPGPVSTEFAETASLGGTDLFKNAATPASVAKDGYAAMQAGELICVSGLPFSMRLQMNLMPLMPRRMLLKRIKGMQEVE